MPRFAVLMHDWPTPHYDLLLEADGVLKAWRLPALPGDDMVIEPNVDHRLLYLDYEGPLSGDRGSVTCYDRGELIWIAKQAKLCVIEIVGKKLSGTFRISCNESVWTLISGNPT